VAVIANRFRMYFSNIFFKQFGKYIGLTPFGTHLDTYLIVPVQVVCALLTFINNFAMCFTMPMTFMLAIIFSSQFRCVDKSLRGIINKNDGNGLSDGADIEDIRKQHEKHCLTLKKADQFLKIYNIGAFFGPLFTIIALLYTTAVQPSALGGSLIIQIPFVAILAYTIIQLILTSAGGILVNHYVSTLLFVFSFKKSLR
jgi:hypothetical protein